MKTVKIDEKLESLLHELEFKDAKELMKGFFDHRDSLQDFCFQKR